MLPLMNFDAILITLISRSFMSMLNGTGIIQIPTNYSGDHLSVSKWAIYPAFTQLLTNDGTSIFISQNICFSQKVFCESLFRSVLGIK